MNKGKRYTEYGFTMVEMAIVILITGMIVGSIFTFLTTQQNQKNLDETLRNQQKVAAALTIFAENYGRLPCPATQDIAANDNGYGNARASCVIDAERNGIVPFRTLGLDQRDIVDGYKHAMTYVVSQTASAPVTTNVHVNCRIDDSWVTGAINRNPNKASFCCREATSQLSVFSNQAGTIRAWQDQPPIAASTGNVNQAAAGNTDPLGYVAYLLISHGAEGGGYYILPSETQQYPNIQPLQGAGDAETENADSDRSFIAMPTNRTAGAAHFDDIVLWRTQQQVMSEMHSNSCATP